MDGNSTQISIPLLDPNSILQADATIIAGLLVLLTISGVLKDHFKESQQEQIWKFLRWIVASSTTAFSLSIIAILIGYGYVVTDTTMTFSRVFFGAGLVIMFSSIIVLGRALKLKNTE